MDNVVDQLDQIERSLKMTRNIGMLLLPTWLMLFGLSALFSWNFDGSNLVMGLLGIMAGAFILIGQSLNFDGLDLILGLLAIVAGGFILIGR